MQLQGSTFGWIGGVLLIGLVGCGGGGGGGGSATTTLDAERPADLTDPTEVAKRYLLLTDEADATSAEFDELVALLDDAVAEAPGDGTFACESGQITLQTGEVADRTNPIGGDDGFELAIVTAVDCRFGGDTLDGALEGGERTDAVEPTIDYVGAGLAKDDPVWLEEGGARQRAFARLFRTEDSDVERIAGVSLSSGELAGSDAAERLDLLGLGGTGFFELAFDRSASPHTLSGQGRVRVDRLTENGNRCSALGTFDFQITQPVEFDSGGTPFAGEIELASDGDTAIVDVAGGGIVVTIGTEETGFDPAALAALESGVDFCADG